LFLIRLLFRCTQYHAQGTGAGATLGGISGALLDSKNPWRGGIIGAAVGRVAGATLTDISMRASQEAAKKNRLVEYRTTDGSRIYRTDPVGYNAQTKCHKVRERIWGDDQLKKIKYEKCAKVIKLNLHIIAMKKQLKQSQRKIQSL